MLQLPEYQPRISVGAETAFDRFIEFTRASGSFIIYLLGTILAIYASSKSRDATVSVIIYVGAVIMAIFYIVSLGRRRNE